MSICKAAFVYFASVFAVGFLFGPIRVMVLEPRFGASVATAIEAPFLLLAMVWVARRLPAWFGAHAVKARFAVGGIAVALVLLVDMLVGGWLRGLTLSAQAGLLVTPAGLTYLALLLAFAAMPWLVGKTSEGIAG